MAQRLTAAVELGVGVGRRTAELCSLAFDCLDYDDHLDADGEHRRSPVLVHDMPKVDKIGCRLPIHEREALIFAQQARVAAQFPTTPPRLLALFPRPLTNPDGTRPLGTSHLQRLWWAWSRIVLRALLEAAAVSGVAAGRWRRVYPVLVERWA